MSVDRRYVFLLGTGRCGSSLLHEVLARHGDVGFVSNVEDNLGLGAALGRHNAALYRQLPPAWTRKGRVRFAPSEAYDLLDREVSPVMSLSSRDLEARDATPWLAGRVAGFFASRAAAQPAPVFTHKFTGWPRAGLLDAALPGSRFVNVVRDGRAVANSWLQMPWWLGYRGPEAWQWGPLPAGYHEEWEASGRDFVVLAGIAWKLLVDAAERAKARLAEDQWLDVRYEDLVRAPRATMRQVLAFAGLPWDDAFEAQFVRFDINPSRTEAWRQDLGPAAERLEASLATHLGLFGYGPTGVARSGHDGRPRRNGVATEEIA